MKIKNLSFIKYKFLLALKVCHPIITFFKSMHEGADNGQKRASGDLGLCRSRKGASPLEEQPVLITIIVVSLAPCFQILNTKMYSALTNLGDIVITLWRHNEVPSMSTLFIFCSLVRNPCSDRIIFYLLIFLLLATKF